MHHEKEAVERMHNLQLGMQITPTLILSELKYSESDTHWFTDESTLIVAEYL